MKKKRYVEALSVKTPCTEEWGRMAGTDQVRFCSHCSKNVNDLSSMTRAEAMRLVRRSNGRLCVRYIKHPTTGAPMYAEQLIQISRRAPRVAAGVMAASMSLSTFAYSQGGVGSTKIERSTQPGIERSLLPSPVKEPTPVSENGAPAATTMSDVPETHGSVWGTITDENGGVIPGATVALLDKKGGEVAENVTDYDGVYRLEQVPLGRYQLVVAAEHFRKLMALIEVTAANERIETLTLDVRTEMVTMGVVAIMPTTLQLVEPSNPLTIAVADEDLDTVRDLIAAGEDVNRADDDGSTPLFAAVRSGNLEIVRLLIDFGAKVNVRNEEKETPLMMLDEDSPVEMVELLIRSGAKVNRVANDGDTALIRAAKGAQPAVLKALIDAGADLDVRNKEGVTALMNAADDENLENVRLLVLAGADINIRDEEGDNAWDYTAEEEIESFLVSHGVVLDPEDLDGEEADDDPENN
ncbi:MAG: ankyrin repeat domain-containing protein [Acidobacteriota bacterium]